MAGSFKILSFIFLCCPLAIKADFNIDSKSFKTEFYTGDNLEQMFIERNLALIAEKMNISISEAAITQARLWDNPTLSFSDINLWKHKEKEFSAELSQSVIISGKRSNLIKIEKISKEISIAKFEDLLLGLKFELRKNIADLYYKQQYAGVIKSQISSLSALINTYTILLEKGNISKGEIIRLKSELFEMESEMSDVQASINSYERAIKNLISEDNYSNIEITELSSNPVSPDAIDINDLISTAFELRADVKIMKLTTAQNKKMIDYDVYDPDIEISFEDAKKIKARIKVGAEIGVPLKTKDFGYIAIGAAKNVIRQGIKEAEKAQLYQDMQGKTHEIITGVVLRRNEKNQAIVLQIGNNEFILPKDEQIPGENFTSGEHIKVYVVDVLSTERGPKIMLSRTHPGFVKRMFELEVPEIFDGTVEVKAISREAGARTKIAVYSKDDNVDAIGACIGTKRSRVDAVISQIGGEKIDIVKYSEDPTEFISAALSPSSVTNVEIISEQPKSCKVTVPDEQLSLAIGNKGQNARLAARLTGYNIDIHPQSGYFSTEE